jgi:hypothetical protein
MAQHHRRRARAFAGSGCTVMHNRARALLGVRPYRPQLPSACRSSPAKPARQTATG